ncbi:phospholipase D-like domain-containing protein [Streptomyces iconiensis]|uniref:phospholipase D-like domain-containing protein n=1 Tax=Streptomyces iconiensis TaxID=1384038 RepID=UPI0024BC1A2F|nr:phospholipase D-like domain-containing protein [Streptomyces iconiensis]
MFNDPGALADGGPSAQQSAVMDQLIGLVRATPAGGEINFVMFEFADGARSTAVKDALLEAHRRGVHVKVVLDSASPDVLAQLKRAFEAGTDRESWAVGCPAGRGCIARNYMHSKFATFSSVRVGGQEHKNVVFQTSSNLNDWYLYNSYNDAVTFSDARVYADYRTYFNDLRAMKSDPDYFWTSTTGATYRGMYYPRQQTDAKDPIANVLKLVKCSYQEGGTTRQTDVRIALTKFNKHRLAIARQLRALRDQGCWVDLVYPAKSESGTVSVDPEVLSALKPQPGREPIQITPCRFDPGNGQKVSLHTKVMMIDGRYDDDITPRVYTGSANFTHLENADDSAVRIAGRDNHTAYLSWFWNLRDTCKAKTPPGSR